jgi:hypothetical protein
MLAIATNVCLHDHDILAHTVPSWLRVFGDNLSSIWIIVDRTLPSGRIGARQDIAPNRQALEKCLLTLATLDVRIHLVALDKIPLEQLSRKWFGRLVPARDQAGTPLLAFIAAFEAPAAELVLRADCDMLFCEQGWLARASAILSEGKADLVEPPYCGTGAGSDGAVSTRALMIKPAIFSRCLPIRACRLDWLRRIHRRLHGRNSFVALEGMLEFARRQRRLRHVVLDNSVGFSVHVNDRCVSSWDRFGCVVRRIEIGNITRAQYDVGWNFTRAAW